jgi:hypothetical protein
MLFGTRFFAVLFLLGLAWGTQAESGVDIAQKKKPAKLYVNTVKQTDGSVIERLDLSELPGAVREAGIPGTPAEWLARMIDPTRNGLIVKRPQLFAEWLDAVTEPRFMTALATVALDPGTYPRTLNRLADPATARNWAEFVDPEVFMRWMAAGLDPRLYQAVFQHMFDPKKYLRWATYSGYHQIDTLPAVESNSVAQAVQNHSGSHVAPPQEGWLQLPSRESRANPWLAISNAYRY